MDDKKHDKLRLPCLEESNLPWAIYTHGSSKNKQVQTFCNISGTSYTSHLKSIPQLRNKSILASINGWLILRDLLHLDMFSIFNLFTLHTVVLPPLQAPENEGGSIKCGLKSTPGYPDCLLLVCFTKASIIFSCRPAQPDCCWISLPIQLQGLEESVSNIFTVNGVMYVSNNDTFSDNFLYWVDDSTSLVLRPLQIRAPISSPLLGFNYLVESCNHVYYIVIWSNSCATFELMYLSVFELDLNSWSWREIKSLNGRSFFLGIESCTWCWGTTNESGSEAGIQRNCIYFHVPSDEYEDEAESETLRVYNLHDDCLLPLQPCPNMLRTSSKSPPVWVIPEHLRVCRVECKDLELSQDKLRQESRLCELPLDMIKKISKHMHLFEYWNFRATSAVFQSLCPIPQWRTNNALPLFLYFNSNGSSKLIDPCRHDSLYHSVSIFLHSFIVWFSKNGWLLASNGSSLQYFNFFTGKRGNYPSFHEYFHLESLAFSTYPTCTDCLTVGIVDNSIDENVIICYHEAGKGTWNSCIFELEDEDVSFYPSNSCPIFLAGAFYILDRQGYLGVFQLVNGEANWRMYAKPKNLKDFYTCHLVESEEEVYSVFIERMGKWVKVFRFDKLMKQWVKVEYLENHIFFISRTSSFSIVTRDHRMRNRIYIPRLYKKGVVFYSQDTRKYHSLTSDDIIEDFYGTSEPLRCCWI